MTQEEQRARRRFWLFSRFFPVAEVLFYAQAGATFVPGAGFGIPVFLAFLLLVFMCISLAQFAKIWPGSEAMAYLVLAQVFKFIGRIILIVNLQVILSAYYPAIYSPIPPGFTLDSSLAGFIPACILLWFPQFLDRAGWRSYAGRIIGGDIISLEQQTLIGDSLERLEKASTIFLFGPLLVPILIGMGYYTAGVFGIARAGQVLEHGKVAPDAKEKVFRFPLNPLPFLAPYPGLASAPEVTPATPPGITPAPGAGTPLASALASSQVPSVPFGEIPLRICPLCGSEILPGAEVCPRCGTPITGA